MNVKYASDTYWSEKMASNYYNMDKALGLQDYNYYQLGVLKNPANAYAQASTGSKFIYKYPEAEDAVVIVGETTSNGEKWYKVVSDLNIDSNYNEISSGAYNWNGYVYVQASNIRKINNGKNGYISPNNVTEYANKNYEYNLYDSGNTFNPKVAISTKDTQYYYDSSLQQRKGQTLLKDRYVMVFAQATLNGRAVSYLVTSDYFHDQKHWVSADSIKFTNTSYGRVTVDTSDNQYTWVNYNTEDKLYSKISGLYTYTYVPVLSSQRVGNDTWYKVPVSLSDNNNVYGYTLASYSNYIRVDLATPIIENTKPVIVAENKTIEEKDSFNPKDKVTAYDNEDGDLTNKIEVVSNKVDTNNPGNYEVVYKVQDSMNEVATKTITVTVKENSAPEIIANDKTIIEGEEFDELKGVTAKDKEDGDLTSKIKVKENTVKETKGTYKVVYEVSDSKGKTTTKEIKVVVKEQSIEEKPKDINPESTKIEEDINDYDIDELLEKQKDGQFNLESLEFNKNTKKFSISGYLIIDGVDNIDKEYALVLVNKNDEDKTYAVNIDSWTKDIPYNLGTVDGHNYEDIWFKGNIDFTDIPNGDYDLYMLGANENSFTIQLVDNFFGVDISKRGEDANHGYNFKVRSDLRTQQIELNIRDELYTTSVSPTYRDMVNEFDTILFKNNKLYLKGYSYNYGGTYKEQLNITRKLLLENTSTYKQEVFELGSSKGLFDIKTKDNKDKTYAWYENEIDLSKLEKGVYSLQVYTKTIDAEDYGEITDMFEELNEKATIGDKNFIITYNKNKQDRIELTIK